MKNRTNKCWVVATDSVTGKIRPAYVNKKYAKESHLIPFENYNKCLNACGLLSQLK